MDYAIPTRAYRDVAAGGGFAAKRQGQLLGLVSQPGLWLQRITTKAPDDSQAAVAIHALEGAMALEEKQGGELVIA